MSFLTINDASIPFVPKLYAKLFKKYPYDPRTSMQPAIPPIAPLAIIVPTNTFLGLIPTYSACFGFNPTVRILYPDISFIQHNYYYNNYEDSNKQTYICVTWFLKNFR